MEKLYEIIFETWRFQVNSYWQRSVFFAAFETAGIAGCWYVISGTSLQGCISGKLSHPCIGVLFSVLGIILTIVWYLNNKKTHAYVDYWWESLKKI